MSFNDRVKNRRLELRLSQAALGKLAGVPQSTIGQIENGRNKSSTKILELATALQTTPEYLLYGDETKKLPENQQPKKLQFTDNIAPYHSSIRSVPLISWVQAGEWTNVELLSPDEFEYVPTTLNLPNGFALSVRGDSMLPEFNEGDIVVVDPDCRPEHGSFVIVDNGDGASFKKLMYDGAIPYFRPLNDRFPTLNADEHTHIIGVVREKIKRY